MSASAATNMSSSSGGGSPNYTYSLAFWKTVATAAGDNTFQILPGNGFGITTSDSPAGNNMQSQTPAGAMFCGARETGKAYTLDLLPQKAENAVPVYWLPWKDKATTSVDRKDFEGSKCEFFMTPRLEGCRFVLTKDKILHVASNAGGAAEGSGGSATRDIAQSKETGGAPSRRLSISTSDINDEWAGYPYAYQACVFGIKFGATWKYKALMKSKADDMGQWTSYIDE